MPLATVCRTTMSAASSASDVRRTTDVCFSFFISTSSSRSGKMCPDAMPHYFSVASPSPSPPPACSFPAILRKNPRKPGRVPCVFCLSDRKSAAHSADRFCSKRPFVFEPGVPVLAQWINYASLRGISKITKSPPRRAGCSPPPESSSAARTAWSATALL